MKLFIHSQPQWLHTSTGCDRTVTETNNNSLLARTVHLCAIIIVLYNDGRKYMGRQIAL